MWVATSRANSMVESIMEGCGCTESEIWLTGQGNFRHGIYPEYKANRIGLKRPHWEPLVKEFLVARWGAQWSDGCEADDMVGLLQTDDTIIAHIDKDINQIPGKHYNWAITRKGKVVSPAKTYSVTPEEGIRFFYYQLLVGDPVDNLKGVHGIGPKKAEAILASCTTERELFETVREAYGCDEDLNMQGACLWIWRKPGDIWNIDTTISKIERETASANHP